MEERLNKLESQLAFQEHTIEQLNEVVTAQRTEIDFLKKEIATLRTDLARSRDTEERDPVRERPPHY